MQHNWSNIIWLARRQMRDLWLAYPLTAIYFCFMGAVVAYGATYPQEIAHLVLMLIVIQPVLSSRYMAWKLDNEVVRHQVFLAGLPIPFRTIVVARLIAMLTAGLINVPLYFGWFWFAVSDWPSIGAFVAWTVFWIGIALICTAGSIFLEFAVSVRKWAIINMTAMGLFFIIVIPLMIFTDIRFVADSMSFARSNPWLVALAGLVLAAVGIVASIRLGERSLRRREFVR